jgi:hypothetical protein
MVTCTRYEGKHAVDIEVYVVIVVSYSCKLFIALVTAKSNGAMTLDIMTLSIMILSKKHSA